MPVRIASANLLAVFDTGGTICVIDLDYVNHHPEDFEYVKEESGSDSNGNIVHVLNYKIKHLTINNIKMKDIDVMAIDFSKIRNEQPGYPVFIIGENLMDGFVWYFDVTYNKWSFTLR